MKIGIFDSGLGGLFILKHIIRKLPQYDYVFLGDTKRMPYGNHSPATIYKFTKQALDYLFRKNCTLIILACNTVSAEALRKIQKNYLPRHYPRRRVLGVIVPTVEEVLRRPRLRSIGILATRATTQSRVFAKELRKRNGKLKVYSKAVPLLAYIIESGGQKLTDVRLKAYLKSLLNRKVQAIVLGCTHYPIIKRKIRKFIGKNMPLFCQDEILPDKITAYLNRHPEIAQKLSCNREREFLVTRTTSYFVKIATEWFGSLIQLKLVKY